MFLLPCCVYIFYKKYNRKNTEMIWSKSKKIKFFLKINNYALINPLVRDMRPEETIVLHFVLFEVEKWGRNGVNVINRSNAGCTVFKSIRNREKFFEYLEKAVDRFFHFICCWKLPMRIWAKQSSGWTWAMQSISTVKKAERDIFFRGASNWSLSLKIL